MDYGCSEQAHNSRLTECVATVFAEFMFKERKENQGVIDDRGGLVAVVKALDSDEAEVVAAAARALCCITRRNPRNVELSMG